MLEITRSEFINLLKQNASVIQTIGYPIDMRLDAYFDELDRHGLYISPYDHHLLESFNDSCLLFNDGIGIGLYEDQHFYYHETQKGGQFIWCERYSLSDRKMISMALVWGGVEKRQWRKYVVNNRKLYNLLVKECKVNGVPTLKSRKKSDLIELDVDTLEIKAIDDFFKQHNYEYTMLNEK